MGTRNRKKETEVRGGVGLVKPRGGAQVTGLGEGATPRATQPHHTEEEPEVTGWEAASPDPLSTHFFREHRLYSNNIGLDPAPCH